jgi:hypothetical protein
VGNGNGAFNRPNPPTDHTHAANASRANDAHRPHGSIRVRRAQGARVDLGLLRSYVRPPGTGEGERKRDRERERARQTYVAGYADPAERRTPRPAGADDPAAQQELHRTRERRGGCGQTLEWTSFDLSHGHTGPRNVASTAR